LTIDLIQHELKQSSLVFEDQQQGEIKVATKVTDNTLSVTFSDNGKGMPKSVFDQLFVPFFTTKHGTGGPGIGMSIVNT